MDDDDGMLLNFDLSAPLVLTSSKAKVVGGSWKARKAANKGPSAQTSAQHDDPNPNRMPIQGRGKGRRGPNDRKGGGPSENTWPTGEPTGQPERQKDRIPQASQMNFEPEETGYNRQPKRARLEPEVDTSDLPPGFITEMPTRPQNKKARNVMAPPPTFKLNPIIADEIKASNASHASGPKQFVSTLFAHQSNSKVQPEKEIQADPHNDIAPFTPSNAPINDEAVTFVKLGLAPVIANHLVSRMGIKAPTGIQKLSLQEMLSEAHVGGAKDVFIRAETGSGKTLAYLLPILDRILKIVTDGGKKLSRDSGVLAIILAPTRELCRQITDVLDKLLRCAVYIVAGSVNGGENKQKEKSRIRKGINILVATPGRLSDHLDNTRVFDVSKVRWLVLDEGDRMMEMGFEADIKKLLSRLDAGSEGGIHHAKGLRGLPSRRMTMLCSATMRMGAQKLGQLSLKDAIHIDVRKSEREAKLENKDEADDDESKAADTQTDPDSAVVVADTPNEDDQAYAPAQLQQWYLATPPKLRLVSLVSILRRALAHGSKKIIVFFSCADSVDFHFSVLTRTVVAPKDATINTADQSQRHRETAVLSSGGTVAPTETSATFMLAPVLAPSPGATSTTASNEAGKQSVPILHRLHGSLPHPLRRGTLANFLHPKLISQTGSARSSTVDPSTPTILFTTDLSSRGLDLPDVDLVVEVDTAFSAAEHLHRVGRTARAGRNGRAIVFLTRDSSEMGYVRVLQVCMHPDGGQTVRGEQAEDIIRMGFGILDPSHQSGSSSDDAASGNMSEWEARATTFQLAVERWVLNATSDTSNNKKGTFDKSSVSSALDLAKNAFQSHVRAYATHVGHERVFFNMKHLHLGHLCKAFGLRVAPSVLGIVGVQHGKNKAGAKNTKDSGKGNGKSTSGDRRSDGDRKGNNNDDDDYDDEITRMNPAVSTNRSGIDLSLTAIALGGEEQVREARRKMKFTMKEMNAGGASDFNLG